MAKGKGGGAGAWGERWEKGEGQWDLVGPWVKGGKGLGHGGILMSPRNILRGIL